MKLNRIEGKFKIYSTYVKKSSIRMKTSVNNKNIVANKNINKWTNVSVIDCLFYQENGSTRIDKSLECIRPR